MHALRKRRLADRPNLTTCIEKSAEVKVFSVGSPFSAAFVRLLNPRNRQTMQIASIRSTLPQGSSAGRRVHQSKADAGTVWGPAEPKCFSRSGHELAAVASIRLRDIYVVSLRVEETAAVGRPGAVMSIGVCQPPQPCSRGGRQPQMFLSFACNRGISEQLRTIGRDMSKFGTFERNRQRHLVAARNGHVAEFESCVPHHGKVNSTAVRGDRGKDFAEHR